MTAPSESTSPSAPVSPIPASYIQERHIRRASANAKLPSPPPAVWEAVSIEFDVPLDKDALGEVWQRFLKRHDSLRSWFQVQEIPAIGNAGQPISKVIRHEVDPATLTWELVEGPTFETGEQVRDYLVSRFDETTSPLQWPALVFAAVEHEDGFHAVLAEDHSFCDGYSNLIAIVEIKSLYREITEDEPAVLPNPGSQLESAREERARLASLTIDSPQTQRWIEYYHSLGGQLQKFPLPLGEGSGEPGGKVLTFELITEHEAEILHKYCKEHGGGFTAGVYAAFAATNYELGGQSQFNMLRAVATRDDERYTYTHGWFINTIPVMFGLDDVADFADLIPRSQQAMNDTKELASVPIQRVIDLVAETMGTADSTGIPFQPPPMISFIDVRLFPTWLATKETSYHKVVQPVPPTTTVFNWLNRYHDLLELVVFFPDNPVAEASIRKYVDHLRSVLRSVVETGRYPLGQLSRA
ncbi:condensation domain-containing protein [Segniliparus rugosus]|uniref:condensation domain-containing protein n=1 Tax=Segniliparus rugosus TaxID=286804 RepID=UPI001FCC2177|nr:condensation domain-containing protein [Segniliparus rugosus]